jgi:hypothetical protein
LTLSSLVTEKVRVVMVQTLIEPRKQQLVSCARPSAKNWRRMRICSHNQLIGTGSEVSLMLSGGPPLTAVSRTS